MQDIREESLNESVKSEQSPRVVLWEIDLTVQGGERYFFCNELNEKGEPVTWQGRQYQAYPIDGSGFEMSGKGSSARPSLTVSNLLYSLWYELHPFENLRRKGHHCHGLTHLSWAERKIFYRFLGKKFCGLFIYPGQSVRQVVAVYAPGDRDSYGCVAPGRQCITAAVR